MTLTPQSNPLAGKLAPPALLVDLPKLITAYYTRAPRSRRSPPSAWRSAPPATAARSFWPSFNEAHVLAMTQAICSYRKQQGITGPLFLGFDTHALSAPAFASALEVLAANEVEVMIAEGDEYTPTPALSHAILAYNRGRTSALADGIVITPSHNPPDSGGFKYNPPNGGPADTQITGWIEAEANRLLAANLDGVKRITLAQARARADHALARLSTRLRRTISATSSTWMRFAARTFAWASIRSAARACTTGRRLPIATG